MRAISGPLAKTDARTKRSKWGCVSMGAWSAVHSGYPGRKLSEKTTQDAPLRAASAMTDAAFAAVPTGSRNTGATCAAAALKTGKRDTDQPSSRGGDGLALHPSRFDALDRLGSGPQRVSEE